MNSYPEYDALSDIYDIWASADPAFDLTHDFYVHLCSTSESSIVVELGIGTGRIAVDIAKNGKDIIGIDISKRMLEKCRLRAKNEGVGDRIKLIQSNIQTFELEKKADVIILPFRSIGHFLSLDSKQLVLQNIFHQLASGGLLVFDHYIFSEPWAKAHDGISRLMHFGEIQKDGYIYIWDTYRYNYQKQEMACTITIENTNCHGVVIKRIHCPLSFSWINPEQVRKIASAAGFEFEAVFGDFSSNELTNNSPEQIWFFRHP